MRSHDPRPDLTAAAAWSTLLRLAYPGRDVVDDTQLYVSLTALRTRGAALVLEAGRYRLAYGEMNPADYRCFRVKWLRPHKARLVKLLQQLANVDPEEKGTR